MKRITLARIITFVVIFILMFMFQRRFLIFSTGSSVNSDISSMENPLANILEAV